MNHTLCKFCDHFVEHNPDSELNPRYAKYMHLDDGNQEYDHDASPGETRDDWKTTRSELFIKHKDDRIGPNSRFHSQRGKVTKDLPPTRCPNCYHDKLYLVGEWIAHAVEDVANTVALNEYQCLNCKDSFWA